MLSFEEQYRQDCEKQILEMGFDPGKLNDTQKDILLQPINAPENYAHDGELSPKQAKENWRSKMKRAGFTALQLFNVERKIF